MNTLNAILTRLADLLLAPFSTLPQQLTLVLCAAAAGALAGIAFRYTSNQAALAALSDRVRANLLAMRLFKDELGVTLRCQGELLEAAALRFWYALPALVVLLVPFVLLLIQLALRYEYRPLRPGESAIVRLELSPQAWDAFQQVQLEAPRGVTVETPALRDADEHSVYWRLRPQQPGTLELRWPLGEQMVAKRLDVAGNARRLRSVSPRRPGSGLWDRLVHPGEPPLPADSPVQAIVVHYPRRATPIFGFDVPWWVTFLVASILAALILRPVLKVRF